MRTSKEQNATKNPIRLSSYLHESLASKELKHVYNVFILFLVFKLKEYEPHRRNSYGTYMVYILGPDRAPNIQTFKMLHESTAVI